MAAARMPEAGSVPASVAHVALAIGVDRTTLLNNDVFGDNPPTYPSKCCSFTGNCVEVYFFRGQFPCFRDKNHLPTKLNGQGISNRNFLIPIYK